MARGAGGGVIEYRLGIVRLTVCDASRRRSSILYRPQLAAFALGDAMGGPPLIGLGGGILNEMPLYLNLFLQRARLGLTRSLPSPPAPPASEDSRP